MNGMLSMSGELQIKLLRCKRAPLSWRIKNALRWSYIWGWFVTILAKGFSKLTGIVTFTSELRIKLIKASGEWIDYGVVSRRCVTDTGVAFVVDAWDNRATSLENMNYHGLGTGAGDESAAETALVAECTNVLNPDSTRATGVRSQPAANQYRSVGTLTFDDAAAVIEHGLLSQAATGGGVLWDRSLFAAINTASGDSIQSTYTLTLTSGG